ncbi:hypothetical protein Ddye_022013 [Dipteronia dyeriana]|uniref:Integrase catalytic domain-containing protein n=1 Tax=Dipteronia dyeriana TaxID=168575 RepID=A0AAD9WY27_9ROSI|nr:hypothetical protein Ddye_022013 [Dipteronia dyeriana]
MVVFVEKKTLTNFRSNLWVGRLFQSFTKHPQKAYQDAYDRTLDQKAQNIPLNWCMYRPYLFYLSGNSIKQGESYQELRFLPEKPLSTAYGQAKYAIVTIDYFTRWVEVEPLSKITRENTTKFLKRNVVCRFETSMIIITDLGKQFDDARFREFCDDFGIDLRIASGLT